MKSKLMMTLCLSSFGLLFGQLAQAQFCVLTNASISGAYGFVASEGGAVTTTNTTTTGTPGTGTTGTTGTSTATYSDTNVGNLLGGIAAGNQFAYSGVLTFDGAGHITAISAPTGTEVAQIGTYNVNSDCSISVSLMDAFGTSRTATQLVGVVLGRGAEIDLTSPTMLQSQTGTGSTSTSTTGTGTSTSTTGTGTPTSNSTQSASGLVIKLVRVLYQGGCSDSNLSGLYGFVLTPSAVQQQTNTSGTTGTGTGTTGTGTTGTTGTGTTGTTGTGTTTTTTSNTATNQPAAEIGYLDFNGAGKIVSTSPSTATSTSVSSASTTAGHSTYSALDFTGTYTVNSDCSGTMTISNSSTSTTGTTTGTGTTGSTGTGTTGSIGTTGKSSANQSTSINFVITQPNSSIGGPQTPGLTLSFSTPDESGSGYALAQ